MPYPYCLRAVSFCNNNNGFAAWLEYSWSDLMRTALFHIFRRILYVFPLLPQVSSFRELIHHFARLWVGLTKIWWWQGGHITHTNAPIHTPHTHTLTLPFSSLFHRFSAQYHPYSNIHYANGARFPAYKYSIQQFQTEHKHISIGPAGYIVFWMANWHTVMCKWNVCLDMHVFVMSYWKYSITYDGGWWPIGKIHTFDRVVSVRWWQWKYDLCKANIIFHWFGFVSA